MTDHSHESEQGNGGPAPTGRRSFLQDGLKVAGGVALASAAVEMLRDPAPAFGAPRDKIDRPTCLAVASASKIVTCDDGKKVFLWTPKAMGNGFDRQKFNKDHNKKASYVAVSNNTVLVASFDGDVSVRNLNNPGANADLFDKHKTINIQVRVPEVWVAAVSADGTRALSGDNFGTILYWDTVNRTVINGFKDADEWVAALAFMPRVGAVQKRFLSGHEDGKMVLWDFTHVSPDPNPDNPNLDPPSAVKRVFSHPDPMCPVNTVAVTSNGRFAVSAGFDATARIWDLANTANPAQPIAVIEHNDIVWRVAMSPDSTKFATASNDGTVRLFDIAGNELPGAPPMEQGGVMGVGFLTNTRIVYTTGKADGNDHIKAWP